MTTFSRTGPAQPDSIAAREKAILAILVLAEPIMEAWAKSDELDEWHCRVEDLIGTAYPSFLLEPIGEVRE